MKQVNESAIVAVGFEQSQIKSHNYLNLRYIGTNTSIMIEQPEAKDGKSIETLYGEAFEEQHKLEFGFNFEARQILIDNIRVRSVGKKQTIRPKAIEEAAEGEALPDPILTTQVYFEMEGKAQCLDSKVYNLETLKANMKLEGPAIILNKTSTIVVEPFCKALIDIYGNVEITLLDAVKSQDLDLYQTIDDVPMDPIELSIFGHRFMSIAE